MSLTTVRVNTQMETKTVVIQGERNADIIETFASYRPACAYSALSVTKIELGW
jgi:hypothetical protein